MNREDARYWMKEIEWNWYYGKKMDAAKQMFKEAEARFENTTAPKSPQGHVSIGEARALTFEGKESYILKNSDERDERKAEYEYWRQRYIDSLLKYNVLLERTEEKEFVREYFEKKYTAEELQAKYHISKAWKRIVAIMMESL